MNISTLVLTRGSTPKEILDWRGVIRPLFAGELTTLVSYSHKARVSLSACPSAKEGVEKLLGIDVTSLELAIPAVVRICTGQPKVSLTTTTCQGCSKEFPLNVLSQLPSVVGSSGYLDWSVACPKCLGKEPKCISLYGSLVETQETPDEWLPYLGISPLLQLGQVWCNP